MDGIHPAQDYDEWLALNNTIINISINSNQHMHISVFII